MATIGKDADKFLFQGWLRTKAEARLRPTGGLSYTRVRELVLERFSIIGLDKSTKYGLHSFRSGGASAAANAGVPD